MPKGVLRGGNENYTLPKVLSSLGLMLEHVAVLSGAHQTAVE